MDLRPHDSHGESLVLFHYTTAQAFHNITDYQREEAVLFTSLKQAGVAEESQPDSSQGEGVYATSKEPAEWESQEQILLNNYCHPTHQLNGKCRIEAEPPCTDFPDCKHNMQRHAAFCLPILVRRAWQCGFGIRG